MSSYSVRYVVSTHTESKAMTKEFNGSFFSIRRHSMAVCAVNERKSYTRY